MSAEDILVLADTHRGAVTDMTFELLGAARQLAATTGGEVLVLVLGSAELGHSLRAAERVFVADDGQRLDYAPDAALGVLETILDCESPRAVLVGSTSSGLDLGPLLAARRNLPLVAGCKSVNVQGGTLRVSGSFCGGKMMADVDVEGRPAVLLVLPGSFPAAPRTGNGTVETLPLPAATGHVRFEEMELPDSGDVDITQEDVLLGVGRGIQQEDNLELVEELAEALGGQLCASRPVVDQGWLPATRQIGKSGMVVKPKCYIALGVSGAPEHVEGMADSDLIISINSDPDAPIFEAAHFGIVADLLDVVPAITEAVKNRGEVTSKEA